MNLLDSASLVTTPNGYKASKLYSIVPSDGTGDMTFSRTGDTATRVNSSGLIETVLANKPRLDYLGSTCPRLLLEPQRTNIVKYSSEQDNSIWVKSATTVTANAIISPDGTTNADKIVESATTAQHFFYQSVTLSTSTDYTYSAYFKAGEKYIVYTRFTSFAGVNETIINLSTGLIVSGTGTLTSVGNGWYRFSKTVNSSTGGSTPLIGFWHTASNSSLTNASFTGDGVSGYYIWGAQLEAGSNVSSYIPTTSASVTRNADSCTKSSASALIGQTEGTLFYDINLDSRKDYTYLYVYTSSNYIGIKINASTILAEVYNSTSQASISSSNTSTGRFKLAIAYKLNDIAFYLNGTLVGTDTSATIPTCDTIDFYNNTTNVIKLNSSSFWKTRLTNQELATLTTI